MKRRRQVLLRQVTGEQNHELQRWSPPNSPWVHSKRSHLPNLTGTCLAKLERRRQVRLREATGEKNHGFQS